jgi:hypothetical protein
MLLTSTEHRSVLVGLVGLVYDYYYCYRSIYAPRIHFFSWFSWFSL